MGQGSTLSYPRQPFLQSDRDSDLLPFEQRVEVTRIWNRFPHSGSVGIQGWYKDCPYIRRECGREVGRHPDRWVDPHEIRQSPLFQPSAVEPCLVSGYPVSVGIELFSAAVGDLLLSVPSVSPPF